MDIKLFCVQYRADYRSHVMFIYAESVQNAVNQFRYKHHEPIIDVFIMEQVGGWQ